MERKQMNILVVKGINQYGVLSYMLGAIADELQHRNFNVQVCTWDEIEKRMNVHWDICIGTQAIDAMFDVDADKYIAWLVDHPVLFYSRLVKHKNTGNYWIGCVDQTHVEYLKQCVGCEKVFFLPHCAGKSAYIKAYKERAIDVFFPSSYLDLAEFENENSEWRTGAVKLITDQVIALLKNNDKISVEQAVKEVLEQLGETVDTQFLEECMIGFGSYIDTYICRYYRLQVVKALLDEGIVLTVTGSGWRDFERNYHGKGKINILSEDMSYDKVLDCMADSKMVLNVFPWFKDGSHERLASALMNGSVCLTDRNEYTDRLLTDDKSAILYDRKKPEELAEKIRYYLVHPDEAEMIANQGKQVAMKYMTAKNCVDMLLKGIDKG